MSKINQDGFFSHNKHFFIEDTENLARFMKTNFPKNCETIIKIADKAANNEFLLHFDKDKPDLKNTVSFKNEIDWLYQPGDDAEFVYEFNRMRYWITLGKAYILTKDEKYPAAFVKQMCSWVRNIKKDDEKCKKAWRTIEVGIRMEFWLKAIAFFKGSQTLTDEILDIFVTSLNEQAEYIMNVYDSYNLQSNWGVMSNHGLFIAGVLLPQTSRTAEYRKEALCRLEEEITSQVYADGTQWEQSPMYHNEVLKDFLDVSVIAMRNGIKLSDKLTEKIKDMCYVDLYWQKPNGNIVAMGDSDDISIRPILSLGSYVFKNGELKFGGNEHLDAENIWDLGYKAAKEYEKTKTIMPKKTAFALNDSGNFYFRSSFKKDASFLHFHCGTLGAGHGHSDQLHFDIFANGEDILVDGGRFTYVDKPERYEFKDSTEHNTITVDNKNFYVCADSWSCSKLCRAINRNFSQKGNYGYVEGGHLGYYDLENGGVYINRRIIAIEPDIFVVCDEFYTNSCHTYQQYFHFNSKGTVFGEGSNFIYKSDKNTCDLKLILPYAQTKLIKTRMSRHYNSFEENTTLRTEFQSKGFTSSFCVIGLNRANCEEKLIADKIPVSSTFKKVDFKDKMIEALNISKGSRKYTVVIAHQEYASPTDTFCADGCVGFGNVVIFNRTKGETKIGTVMQW